MKKTKRLELTLKAGESILVGETRIVHTGRKGWRGVMLGFEAPRNISITRPEVERKRREESGEESRS